ncbi:hypothetical protein [Rhizobium laguerreae]|uniref:hypothetical protein n=1 Tax=Rhizobium laguerreae TaxID=1076926 RepID=UPI001C8FDF57|nr:hypothetical protein [Rhizobium laguerreae]MBY3220912.1 hypothetical protein [Rhizobium laguerreae]
MQVPRIRYSRSLALRSCVSALTLMLMQSPLFAAPNDTPGAELAVPLLDFGVSTAKLVWLSTRQTELPEGMKPTMYSSLAIKVQQQINEGRAAAGVVGATFNLLSASTSYASVADPEPFSKIAARLVAYGAKKTGDYMTEEVLKQSGERARIILSEALKASHLTDVELHAMSHEQIASYVAGIKVGGQQLSSILDDPKNLRMVQDEMIDIVSDNALEALRRTDAIQLTVEDVKKDIAAARAEIDDVRTKLERRTSNIEHQMNDLNGAVEQNSTRLTELEGVVAEDHKALSAVAEISFSGWTTQQKLMAARADIIPGLEGAARDALIASLVAQQKQEKLISDVSSAATDLREIGAIATNLNLPPDIVQAVNTASTVATGAAQFFAGDYLGAISSVTSLMGMGKPDPAAERHSQMMQFLADQFAEVNRRLDTVIALQKQTIDLLGMLREEQQEFRNATLSKLNRIESITLTNDRILQAILKQEWRDCDSLTNNPTISGKYHLQDRAQLLKVLSDPVISQYAERCYRTMVGYLDARMLSADWAGLVISADAVPDRMTPQDDSTHSKVRALEHIDQRAYETAASLLLADFDADETRLRPARILAKVSQPMPNVELQESYAAALARDSVDSALVGFNCADRTALNVGLRELLCFRRGGNAEFPSADRLPTLFRSAMLGPQVEHIVHVGLFLATFADLSYFDQDRELHLVFKEDIEEVSKGNITTNMEAARRARNGQKVLERLKILSEAFLLQQSIAYGDYTAKVAERALYDTATKTLNTAPNNPVMVGKAAAAVEAMRANPILARNVVLLAIRHAIAQSLGSMEVANRANFQRTRYRWAYDNFVRGNRCGVDELALSEWRGLLPGWEIIYEATEGERQTPGFQECPLSQSLYLGDDPERGNDPPLPGLGSGPAIKIADFYVQLPSSMELSIGRFEQPDSLLRAMAMRDEVSQAIAERTISETVDDVLANEPNGDTARDRLALDLLNAVALP